MLWHFCTQGWRIHTKVCTFYTEVWDFPTGEIHTEWYQIQVYSRPFELYISHPCTTILIQATLIPPCEISNSNKPLLLPRHIKWPSLVDLVVTSQHDTHEFKIPFRKLQINRKHFSNHAYHRIGELPIVLLAIWVLASRLFIYCSQTMLMKDCDPFEAFSSNFFMKILSKKKNYIEDIQSQFFKPHQKSCWFVTQLADVCQKREEPLCDQAQNAFACAGWKSLMMFPTGYRPTCCAIVIWILLSQRDWGWGAAWDGWRLKKWESTPRGS